MEFKWSERKIASYIAMAFFKREYFCILDNCQWTGHECDMLGVTKDLRLIDIEIKISRADLKADSQKQKWKDFSIKYQNPPNTPTYKEHPRKIWKHYYCMPESIWKPELLECLPSQSSGVILLKHHPERNPKYDVSARLERRAKPNTKADKISHESVIELSRLASLRMWNAYDQLNIL